MNKSCLGEMKGGVNFVEYGNTGRRKRKEKKESGLFCKDWFVSDGEWGVEDLIFHCVMLA
jgi:hypothetical protein